MSPCRRDSHLSSYTVVCGWGVWHSSYSWRRILSSSRVSLSVSLFLRALKKGLALTMGSRSRRRRRTSSGPVGLHANRRITQLASYLRSARFHRPHISWTDLCLVPLTPAHSTTLRYSHGHSIDSPPASINDAKCGGALHLGEPRSPVRYLLPTRIHGERSAASPRQWMFSATM